MSFPLPTRPRAARHLAMRVSRSARFTKSAGVLSRIRRQALLRPKRLPSFTRPREKFILASASSQLTRPGFTTKIPHPLHNRDPKRTVPSKSSFASRLLARTDPKGSLSKASGARAPGTSCRRLQPTFIRLSKTSTRVSLATGFVPGLRPFLPGGAARFTASHPARGVPELEHESIVLSRARSPTEPLDVPSRPWSLSLPACLPETSSPFSSHARELTRCPEPGRLQPMRPRRVPLRGRPPAR